jgi:hypothetical protein
MNIATEPVHVAPDGQHTLCGKDLNPEDPVVPMSEITDAGWCRKCIRAGYLTEVVKRYVEESLPEGGVCLN